MDNKVLGSRIPTDKIGPIIPYIVQIYAKKASKSENY